MKLIVLAGLVSIEKIELAVDLVQHYRVQGQRVTLLDNIQRVAIESEIAPIMPQRITGELLPQLHDILASNASDVVVLAASETLAPAELWVTLADMQETFPELELCTLALIDLRTCDCFPMMRELLEQYADYAVHMPYDLDEVLHDVGT